MPVTAIGLFKTWRSINNLKTIVVVSFSLLGITILLTSVSHNKNNILRPVFSPEKDQNHTTSRGIADDLFSSQCDEQCIKFNRYVTELTTQTKKQKAAIYFLTQMSRMQSLLEAIANLDRNYNNEFRYPIIIFHEKDFISERYKVSRASNSTIFFQTVTFSIPSFLKKVVPDVTVCSKHSVGYRHMCRFQAKGIYEQPIMANLHYYWRLDDDSQLLSKIPYDVFQYMEDHQIQYGYNIITGESPLCVVGLWEAADAFIAKHNIIPTFYEEWPRGTAIYYNNFEISSMKLWQSSDYQRYINFIDSLGGIYYSRWGDAPIKSIAVSLFLPKQTTHKFIDFEYNHQISKQQ